LVEFPPVPPVPVVGTLAVLADIPCMGSCPLRHLQPKTDQVALHGQDGQGHGVSDTDDISGRQVINHRNTSLRSPAVSIGGRASPPQRNKYPETTPERPATTTPRKLASAAAEPAPPEPARRP